MYLWAGWVALRYSSIQSLVICWYIYNIKDAIRHFSRKLSTIKETTRSFSVFLNQPCVSSDDYKWSSSMSWLLAARLTKLTAAKVSSSFYLDEMQFGVWPHGQFLDTHFNISSFRRTKLLTEFTWKNSTKLFWEWPEDPFRNCGIISFSGSFILWVWELNLTASCTLRLQIFAVRSNNYNFIDISAAECQMLFKDSDSHFCKLLRQRKLFESSFMSFCSCPEGWMWDWVVKLHFFVGGRRP